MAVIETYNVPTVVEVEETRVTLGVTPMGVLFTHDGIIGGGPMNHDVHIGLDQWVLDDLASSGDSPTALVGLIPIDGVSEDFIRADGAPALDQTISPVWTGDHTFEGDVAFTGDNVTVDGSPIITDDTVPKAADPTALVNLTMVPGTASTWMRSDAAPALDQTIVPTWTGLHSFNVGYSTSDIAIFTDDIADAEANVVFDKPDPTSARELQVFGGKWITDFDSSIKERGVRLGGTLIALEATDISMSLHSAQVGSRVVVAGLTERGNAILAAEAPPTPDYIVDVTNSTDVTIYSTGAFPSAWVDVCDLLTITKDLLANTATIFFELLVENSGSKEGTFEIGISLNGATPIPVNTILYSLPAGIEQIFGNTAINANPLPTGTTARLQARAISGKVGTVFVARNSQRPSRLKVSMVGTAGGAIGGNPTALIGLTAINGTALTWIRSDAAPALDQGINPVWTGNHTFVNPPLVGTTPIPTGLADPTASIGLAVVNGSATTAMRSDAAPKIDVAIAPTWTGQHTFTLPPLLGVDPTAAMEAVTKQYVDNIAAGLTPKAAVFAATTANITLSGTQTIDGVAVPAGKRVLVKNQTNPAENGIYITATGAWTRSTDMDSWLEIPAAYTFVEEGTINADVAWVCTANEGGTLNTTPITWVQFAGAGTYTAGFGLLLTGTQFSLDQTVSPSWTGLHSFSSIPNVPNQSWTYAKLQNVSASSRVLGRISAGAGVVEELSGANLTTIIGGSALTKTDDTNVTLALGGTPATALLQAASLTLGWTGLLAVGRGGSGAGSLTGYLKGNGTSAFTAVTTIPYSDISGSPPSTPPGGSTTQIQYNNAGAFAGDADLTWDATTNTMTVGSLTTIGQIQGGLGGQNLRILGGPATSFGGGVNITGTNGAAGSNSGGGIFGVGGNATGTGTGGNAQWIAGNGSTTGFGGNAFLVGGDGGTPGGAFVKGGNGTGTNSIGGAVQLLAGVATGTGNGGSVTIQTGVSPSGTAGAIIFTTGTTAAIERLRILGNGGWAVSTVEGLDGQVLASQGPGLTPVWRTAGSGSIDLTFKFSTTTTGVDPGNQAFNINSATYSAATLLGFDTLTVANFDASTILSLLRDGNRIYLQQANDGTRAVVYEVTAAATNMTGWWRVPVRFIATVGGGVLFASNANTTAIFILSSSSTAVADPSATIGLTAIVGAASTAMRSDAAPALSQAIAPTWTGTHVFTGDYSKTFAVPGVSIGKLTNDAYLTFYTTGVTDAHRWEIQANNSNVFVFRSINDAYTAGSTWLAATRSVAAITNIALGNTTDNPTYTFNGSGLVTANSPVRSVSGTGIHNIALSHTSMGGGALAWNAPGAAADGKAWDMYVDNTAMHWRIANDALSGVGDWLTVTRSGMAITSINFTATALTLNGSPIGGGSGSVDQTASYTWTNTHTFTKVATTGISAITMSSTLPRIAWNDTDSPVDGRWWGIIVDASQWVVHLENDAHSTSVAALRFTRSGAVLTNVEFGNATNNPTYNFLGTGAITWNGKNIAYGNWGNQTPHSTFTDFNAAGIPPGATYIQNLTNGPGLSGTGGQYYHMRLALGSDYPTDSSLGAGTYGLDIAIPRISSGSPLPIGPYICFRYLESGVWGSWMRASCGNADQIKDPNGFQLFGSGAGGHAFTCKSAASNVSLQLQNSSGTTQSYVYTDGSGNYGFLSGAGSWALQVNASLVDANGRTIQTSSDIFAGGGFRYMSDTAFYLYNTSGYTYGSWRIGGTRGGYVGICLDDASGWRPTFMSSGSSATGILYQNSGPNRWLFYDDNTNFRITLPVIAPAYNATSSRAIKRETGVPTGAAYILSRLRPVLYKLLAEGDDAVEQMGLIAEEVHELCPQLSDGKTISYDRLALLLLADWQREHCTGVH